MLRGLMLPRIRVFARGSILDFSRRQNVIFWVSQIAVILSTILGVFLAASQGLESAVEFHAATKLERKYFSLKALRQEVYENSTKLIETSEKNLVKDENGEFKSFRSLLQPDLNWFVWQTMARSPETLDLPVEILHGVNNYHIQLQKQLGNYNQGPSRDRLRAQQELYQLSLNVQSKLIDRMEQQIERYRQRLEPYDSLGIY